MPLHKIVRATRISLWLLALFFLIWIANKNLLPSGKLRAQCTADGCSQAVTSFAANEKNHIIGTNPQDERYLLITADPLTFTVRTPKTFSSATINLEFKNPFELSSIDFGARGAKGGTVPKNIYRLHGEMETLSTTWDSTCEGDTCLFMRPFRKDTTDTEPVAPKHYDTIDGFLKNLPPVQEIETFNYNLTPLLRLPEYTPADRLTEIATTLRGFHEIYTYVQHEPLYFKFTLQDLNLSEGPDAVKVVASLGSKTVAKASLDDDGVTQATGNPSGERTVELRVPDPEPGLYSITVQTKSDDVFIRHISTQQHLIDFRKRLYLADNDAYAKLGGVATAPADVLVVGTAVKATTTNQKSIQTITIDGKPLRLRSISQQEVFSRASSSMGRVQAPKNDVLLGTDGYFALNQEQLFDPTLLSSPALINPIPDTINYVIANYPRLRDSGNGWLHAQTEFDAKELYRNVDGEYTFTIDAPEISSQRKYLELKKISVTFQREPITLGNIWGKIWRRISSL